ncbi:MAG: methyltransferase domain-containing protein, partial [Chloroflexi bacterium]|nr:methyltransferase domain-containing protein [Chloroflexota bacterium]
GLDPDDDRTDGIPHVEHLYRNSRAWGVENQVIGLKLGVPETHFASNTFDYVHSTTTLEMVRGILGADFYRKCLDEIYRILRPGGIFGLGEPMHLDVPIPADLSIYTSGEGAGPEGWAKCFATIAETEAACRAAGFEIIEAAYAPDA